MNQSQIHVYDFLKLVARKSCSHYIFHILLDFSLRMTSSLPSVFFFLLQQIYALRITNPRATCSFEPNVVRVVRKLPKIVSNANQMQSLIRKHRYQYQNLNQINGALYQVVWSFLIRTSFIRVQSLLLVVLWTCLKTTHKAPV